MEVCGPYHHVHHIYIQCGAGNNQPIDLLCVRECKWLITIIILHAHLVLYRNTIYISSASFLSNKNLGSIISSSFLGFCISSWRRGGFVIDRLKLQWNPSHPSMKATLPSPTGI